MAAMGLGLSEVCAVLDLALPAVLTNFFASLLQLVDASFVGHIGPLELAAASLGNAYFSMGWFFMLGVSTALDTLAAQANGAGDRGAVLRWTVTACAVLLGLAVPFSALLLSSSWAMQHILGQPADRSELTGTFCVALIPGVPFLALSTALQKYQQAQSRMIPSVISGLCTNILNVAFNYTFIYAAGLGFVGSPLATSASRAVGLLLLSAFELLHQRRAVVTHKRAVAAVAAGYIDMNHSLAGGERPSPVDTGDSEGADSARSQLQFGLSCDATRRFLKLGLPGGVMLALEAWVFEFQTVLAGVLGQTSVDAHTIMLSVASFTFLSFPFGIATAASVRVGNLLGAQKPLSARAAAHMCLLMGVGVMSLFAALIYLLRTSIGELFTQDAAVIALVSKLAPICALFQIADGFQGVSGGVLRGLGLQPLIAAMNLCSFWLLAAPLGAFLAFGLHWGVEALWWGLAIGLSAGCCGYAFVLVRLDWHQAAKRALVQSSAGSAKNERAQPLLSAEHM